MKKVMILDTGCANLASLEHSVKKLGFDVNISSSIDDLLKSNKLLIPGVGTPIAAMKRIRLNNLSSFIRNYQGFILGICLGMQLLCSFSEECKDVEMLNIFKIRVNRINVKNLPLPHNGWNTICWGKENILFKNINREEKFYFLHSYAAPVNKYTICKSNYGINFSAAIQKKNFFGVQFHPEKSGLAGSKLIKNFLEI
ncbi:imidazole glycerol phosphate synthase subunit HisH [Buchnera aphidicola (Mindarus keteleerifoliae)]|uniref:imidazole glycerol phosphate synthase subunit HisH n=1 Tax=Buchnera aphidicola TaxID=9 RepID=UPI0031B6CEC6